eukprot:13674451-Heterocapsa_arctica.AAC.1
MVGTTPGSGHDRKEMESDLARKPGSDVHGYREGVSSSSAAGSHGHIITRNSFAELEEAKRAEEI